MKEQPDGLRDCFSEDLLAQMQGVDVMIMNNEFTYVNKKGQHQFTAKLTHFVPTRRKQNYWKYLEPTQ